MIEVNLLPEDRRPVERTPLPRFLTILVGVVGLCVEGILLVMILADSPRQKNRLRDVELRIAAARERMARIKDFENRIKEVKARNSDINDLYRFRRTWAPLLHRMSAPEVLPRNIWYREISLKQGRAVRGTEAPDELILRGYARGSSDADSADSMYQATQAIDALVENLKLQGEDFKSNFIGNLDKDGGTLLNPQKADVTELVELSPPKGALAGVRRAAAFGIKLELKPKKASEAGKKD